MDKEKYYFYKSEVFPDKKNYIPRNPSYMGYKEKQEGRTLIMRGTYKELLDFQKNRKIVRRAISNYYGNTFQ